MDIVNPLNRTSAGLANLAEGNFVADGTAVNVILGFRPRLVKLINATAATVYEKTAGMAATAGLRTVTAGTTTIQTSSDIVINEDGFTIRPGVAVDENVMAWYAMN